MPCWTRGNNTLALETLVSEVVCECPWHLVAGVKKLRMLGVAPADGYKEYTLALLGSDDETFIISLG